MFTTPAPQQPSEVASETLNSTASLDKNSISETSTTHSVQRAQLVEKYDLGWIFTKGCTKKAHAVESSVIEKADLHQNEKEEEDNAVDYQEQQPEESRSSEPEIVTEEQILEAEQEEYAAGVRQKIILFEKSFLDESK